MSEPRVVAGRYTLVRRIGSGAMGTVWLARDERLHRQVAVKQVTGLTYEGKNAELARLRAMREGRVVARLNHPNAVSIYDVAIHNDEPWLVMEYVPSKTLTESVRDNGVLPPHYTAAIGAQIADALTEAHRVDIVHRDVKPSNVLLTEAGKAKITDFGIARGSADLTLTESGLITGTPAYFAPEIARGAYPSRQSDVWSLGATLYFAVEATPPFGTDDNPLVLLGRVATQEVPAPRRAGPLGPVLNRLLARSPEQRPTMAEARAMLARVSGGAAVPVGSAAGRTGAGQAVVEPVTAPLPSLETPTESSATPTAEAPAGPAVPAGKPVPAEQGVHAGPAEQAVAEPAGYVEKPVPTEKPAPAEPAGYVEKPLPAEPAGPEPKHAVLANPASKAPAGRRTVRIVALAAVLALVGLGWYLVGGRDAGPAGRAGQQTGGGAPSASSVQTPTRTSPTSTPSAAPSAAPSSRPSASPSPEPSSASSPMRAGTMTRFISDYYGLLPGNQAEGWKRLGPGLKQIGYRSYTNFWSSIESVRVRDLRADPAGARVTGTVIFVTKDGRTSTEQHSLALVTTPDGTGLLINRDTLLRA
ncbi:MAG TPA: protein kinase [Mycobacteriales bacterium]|nr:protein kinase [Mycobacteriales bacterium]